MMRIPRCVLVPVVLAALASVLALPLTSQEAPTAEPAPGPPAVLEYRTVYWGTTVTFLEIDGQRHDAMRPSNGMGRMLRKKFDLAPGRHRVGFVTDATMPLSPQGVEFEALAGKRYKVELDNGTFQETVDGVTTLFYHHYFPVVSEEQGKKFVRVASGAAAPFAVQRDAAGNLLLFADASLPAEKTARVYCQRRGLIKAPVVFFASISGDAGPTRVEYRRGSDPWQLRLLPGSYRFVLTLEGGAWQIAQVRSGTKELSLQAEAGHTYLLDLDTKATDTQVSRNVIGGTQMTTAFYWNVAFVDVTGKEPAKD